MKVATCPRCKSGSIRYRVVEDFEILASVSGCHVACQVRRGDEVVPQCYCQNCYRNFPLVEAVILNREPEEGEAQEIEESVADETLRLVRYITRMLED